MINIYTLQFLHKSLKKSINCLISPELCSQRSKGDILSRLLLFLALSRTAAGWMVNENSVEMAEQPVYCVSADMDESLGCVFNEHSRVEKSETRNTSCFHAVSLPGLCLAVLSLRIEDTH